MPISQQFDLNSLILSAMDLLFKPSAAANMMPALRTNFCGVVGLLLHLSNVSLSSSDISIFLAIPAMPLLSNDKKVHSSYFRDWTLVANRMKKRGMSWTIKGAQRMARLISLREMGELHSWITRKDKREKSQLPEKEIGRQRPNSEKDTGAWLEVNLPALYGPHQNRPWAKVLRALARGVSEV